MTPKSKGLLVLDVSNPSVPTLLGSYDTPGNASDVTINGTTAYVAAGEAGLVLIDVSESTNPTLLGSYDTPGYAYDVTVDGTIAYVASGYDGLHILRLSFALIALNIHAPATALLNTTSTFTTSLQPTQVAQPITYTWSPEPTSGQDTSTATYHWQDLGPQTIVVTAANAIGEVTTKHTVFVQENLSSIYVFLPLVQRVP